MREVNTQGKPAFSSSSRSIRGLRYASTPYAMSTQLSSPPWGFRFNSPLTRVNFQRFEAGTDYDGRPQTRIERNRFPARDVV